jgi:DNA-binding transcriptional LysR family regulator
VARELNATQPTISHQLQSLRKALGTQLFERQGGRFRLTQAGERLRRYAEETLDGLRAMHQDIAVLKGSLAGSLAVGVTYFVVDRVMPRLPRFRAQFPGVNVHVHADRPDPLFAQLLAETLDVVCFLKIRTPPGLVLEPFAEEELVVIASPRHRLARRRRVSAAELSEEKLIMSNVSAFRELVEARLAAAGVTPRVVEEVQNYETVKDLVRRNLGYSLHVKPMVAAELAARQLVSLRLDGPALRGELVVGYRSRPTVSPLIRQFADFLRSDRGPIRRRAAVRRPRA